MLGLGLFLELLSLVFILYSLAASFPKMFIETEKSWQRMQSFQQQVSVVNKYNIRRHYETHHAERYLGLQG